MLKKAYLLIVLTMVIAAMASCGGEQDGLQVNDGVAARIGNMKFSDEDIDEIFELLPDSQKDNFRGPSGRAKFIDMVINDELFHLEAKRMNLSSDKEIKKELEAQERRILIGAFYQRKILEAIEVSDEMVEQYYQNNENLFINQALLKAQHIFSADSAKCAEWRERVEAGEKFSAIAKKESEDKSTSENYGNLGYFNPGGYVKFIGRSDAFTDALETLAVGELSGVIKHEKGYSIVRINDRKPESIKPLSEVRKTIIERIQKELVADKLDSEIENLRGRYKPVNYAHEKVLETTRSPEQLWEIAQAEDASYTRILYYRELVNKYPEHKYAPQALFMIGFVYAEELADHVMARRTFDELLKDYPDAEIAESAKWMIKNMQDPDSEFDSPEDVQEQVEKDKE